MERYVQSGLVVDEVSLGAMLHIDESKHEAWVMFRSTPDNAHLDGFRHAVARAARFGYAPIPVDEDEGVLEFLPGGEVRHWLVRVANEQRGEAAA